MYTCSSSVIPDEDPSGPKVNEDYLFGIRVVTNLTWPLPSTHGLSPSPWLSGSGQERQNFYTIELEEVTRETFKCLLIPRGVFVVDRTRPEDWLTSTYVFQTTQLTQPLTVNLGLRGFQKRSELLLRGQCQEGRAEGNGRGTVCRAGLGGVSAASYVDRGRPLPLLVRIPYVRLLVETWGRWNYSYLSGGWWEIQPPPLLFSYTEEDPNNGLEGTDDLSRLRGE